MDQVLHLHEFFVEGNHPEESHVLLNITEPSTLAEKDKGYFFVICEINNADKKYIAKMQNIVDEIENSYYEIPDEFNQTALEVVLNKINQENISMIKADTPLHCIIGVIRENELIFSFYGQPQMILFYKTKDGTYKKMDLVKENINNEEEPENEQLFSQIVQGKIGPSDFFFAGTPNIIDYFNHDRLQKIITTRLPRQSSEHLQRVLSELRSNLSFGGIVINLQKGENAIINTKISPIKKGSSARSLKNLFGAEKNTANILSPSFLPKFQEKIDSALTEAEPEIMGSNHPSLRANTEITSSHLRARQERVKTPADLTWQVIFKQSLFFTWKVLKYVGRALFMFLLILGAMFSGIARNLLLLFFVITNYQDRRRNILSAWAKWWHNLKDNIKRLPLITKFLVISALLLGLIFSTGIWYTKTKQAKEAKAQAFFEAIDNIKAKEETAKGFLVYGDTQGALDKLNEAKTILDNLVCESNTEKNACQNTNKEIGELLMKARKITIVQPELLADWSITEQSTKADHVFMLDNRIYGFGRDNTNVFFYDLLTRQSGLITPPISVHNFSDVSVPKENDYAILLYDEKNLVEFKPRENSWKKIDISFPNPTAKISSAIVYNRRVYSLDTAGNQIYKHDVIVNGFSLGAAWLQDDAANIRSAVDIAIDGDVFALDQNGTIHKFTKGQPQTFNISKIEPSLTSADRIWTYNDINYIYVLDSVEKRVLVIDKLGQVKNQLTAAEFVKPTGMIVDEIKNTIYILDSNRLYRMNLK